MDLHDKRPVTGEDFQKIAGIHIISFLFFGLCYVVAGEIMESKKSNKIYQEMEAEKKADYLSRIVANIHALFSATVGYMVLFHTWYDSFC